MSSQTQQKASRAELRRRKREVELLLTQLGLLGRGPRRLLQPAQSSVWEDHAAKLRQALEQLGPVFSSFGLFLASRPDLLPARDCLQMASIPQHAPPLPLDAVRGLISQELGRPAQEVFLDIAAPPVESQLLFQTQRAYLPDGHTVEVTVVRPGLEDWMERDFQMLPLLQDALQRNWKGWPPLEEVIDDFRRDLESQIDLTRQAQSLDALSRDIEGFQLLAALKVHRDLSTSRILTVDRMAALRLTDVLPAQNGNGPFEPQADPPDDLPGSELARRLCLAWLRQALFGRLFPVDPSPGNVSILPSRQIVFNGGSFAALPADAQPRLLDYLITAAGQDPDSACTHLLSQLMPAGPHAASQDELRQWLRQVAPFRDGGLSRHAHCDSLAEHLFVHWRLVGEHGYKPRPYLIPFYQGLFRVTLLAQRLSPGRDSLKEGLEDLRVTAGMAQMQGMANPSLWSDNLNQYAGLMIELPKKLDQALTRVAQGGGSFKLQIQETEQSRQRKNSTAAVLALLMLVAALGLVSNHLDYLGLAGEWPQRVSVFLFLLLGMLLLRAASRAG